MKPETLAIHAARCPDPASGAIAPPISLSTTFERAADGGYPKGYSYGRTDNPTRSALEQAIAALEGGAGAACFASGTAASMAAFSLLAPGDHVIAPAECYHGTGKQLKELVARMGVRVSFVETGNLRAVEDAWTDATRMLWIETPSNPRLLITDIAGAATLAHSRGGLLVCDSTFATPVTSPCTRPPSSWRATATPWAGHWPSAKPGSCSIGCAITRCRPVRFPRPSTAGSPAAA